MRRSCPKRTAAPTPESDAGLAAAFAAVPKPSPETAPPAGTAAATSASAEKHDPSVMPEPSGSGKVPPAGPAAAPAQLLFPTAVPPPLDSDAGPAAASAAVPKPRSKGCRLLRLPPSWSRPLRPQPSPRRSACRLAGAHRPRRARSFPTCAALHHSLGRAHRGALDLRGGYIILCNSIDRLAFVPQPSASPSRFPAHTQDARIVVWPQP